MNNPRTYSPRNNGSRVGTTDALMLMVTLLWAVNLSMIKIGLREFTPHAFNAVRLTLAAVVYLVILVSRRETFALARGDGWRALVLGVLGITAYQLFFIQAIGMTHASTASVVLGTSPIFIALLSTALGQEKISWAAWMGILVSFAGCFFVVSEQNGGAPLTWSSLRGTILILLANACWAGYTVYGKPVLDRNAPFKLAALSTALGTLLYLPFAAKDIAAVNWARVSPAGWAAIAYSGLIAIVLCFAIFYASVQKVGSSKTGIYSNLTPIFATAVAAVFLGEHISTVQAIGSAIVLAGVWLTRSGYRLFGVGPQQITDK